MYYDTDNTSVLAEQEFLTIEELEEVIGFELTESPVMKTYFTTGHRFREEMGENLINTRPDPIVHIYRPMPGKYIVAFCVALPEITTFTTMTTKDIHSFIPDMMESLDEEYYGLTKVSFKGDTEMNEIETLIREYMEEL